MSDVKKKRRPREFRCEPLWCKSRRAWQYVWSCREVGVEPDGKKVHGPWVPCNFIADVDFSGKQADSLRKIGCTVTLEPIPAKHP